MHNQVKGHHDILGEEHDQPLQDVWIAIAQAWSSALARYAITARPENLDVISGWEGRWQPAAERAVGGLAEVFADAPAPTGPAAAAFRAGWASPQGQTQEA